VRSSRDWNAAVCKGDVGRLNVAGAAGGWSSRGSWPWWPLAHWRSCCTCPVLALAQVVVRGRTTVPAPAAGAGAGSWPGRPRGPGVRPVVVVPAVLVALVVVPAVRLLNRPWFSAAMQGLHVTGTNVPSLVPRSR
jgi:hypothetical protein